MVLGFLSEASAHQRACLQCHSCIASIGVLCDAVNYEGGDFERKSGESSIHGIKGAVRKRCVEVPLGDLQRLCVIVASKKASVRRDSKVASKAD